MKKSANQIVFKGLSTPCSAAPLQEESKENNIPRGGSTTIEFLPCLFQNNVDESNKAIYFDSIVRQAEPAHVPRGMESVPFKQVSLQGRRMVGLESDLPEGYSGFVFHRPADGADDDGANAGNHYRQKTHLSKVGDFFKTTEWRKDQWVASSESYPRSVASYLECAAILNQED